MFKGNPETSFFLNDLRKLVSSTLSRSFQKLIYVLTYIYGHVYFVLLIVLRCLLALWFGHLTIVVFLAIVLLLFARVRVLVFPQLPDELAVK